MRSHFLVSLIRIARLPWDIWVSHGIGIRYAVIPVFTN